MIAQMCPVAGLAWRKTVSSFWGRHAPGAAFAQGGGKGKRMRQAGMTDEMARTAGGRPGAVLLAARAASVACLIGLSAAGGLGLGALLPFAAAQAQESGAAPAEVAASVETLIGTMRLADTVEILREEGQKYGRTLEADMFPGAGGAGWEATVALIYDAPRMQQVLGEALQRELARAPEEIAAMQAFFASDLGQKVLKLEIEARRTLLDEAAEEAARLAWEDLEADDPARVDLLERFVQANDLVESNVMGALNANLAFYRGMADGGAFGGEMTEEQMLADVWAQEADVRGQTTDWLYPYLTLAYGPLSEAELQDYTAFSSSQAGQVLNAALFAAFDEVFTPVSRALGLAVAQQMQGQDI